VGLSLTCQVQQTEQIMKSALLCKFPNLFMYLLIEPESGVMQFRSYLSQLHPTVALYFDAIGHYSAQPEVCQSRKFHLFFNLMNDQRKVELWKCRYGWNPAISC
jgi:hypothetical protein